MDRTFLYAPIKRTVDRRLQLGYQFWLKSWAPKMAKLKSWTISFEIVRLMSLCHSVAYQDYQLQEKQLHMILYYLSYDRYAVSSSRWLKLIRNQIRMSCKGERLICCGQVRSSFYKVDWWYRGRNDTGQCCFPEVDGRDMPLMSLELWRINKFSKDITRNFYRIGSAFGFDPDGSRPDPDQPSMDQSLIHIRYDPDRSIGGLDFNNPTYC